MSIFDLIYCYYIVEGFKLGHFKDPCLGFLKAVFWNEQEAFMFPFNSNPEKSNDESEGLEKHRTTIVLNDKKS